MARVESTNAGSYKLSLPKSLANVERQAANLSLPLGRHHRVVRDEKSGKEVHVFAIAGPPVFETDDDDSANAYDFNINIPIGPVIFYLTGSINTSTLTIGSIFSVQVPFYGTYTLGWLGGSLITSVFFSFKVSGILVGAVKVYSKNGWLWMDVDVSIFGTEYGPMSLQLIPIPGA